ncbi:MAG: hypothetical protein COW00_19235, partial [Bdellovibrio sp. CG12_big_fil_rev_8_21_14_0_65_39_13]
NLALNDQFFNSIDMPLLRPEDSKLKSSCRLDSFNQLDKLCGKNQKANPARIKQIQKALGFNSGSLKQNLSQMFLSNLGQRADAKSCPVAGAGQGFLMKGQLDDESSYIFNIVKDNRTSEIEQVFERFPQLKLLDQSEQRESFLNFARSLSASLSDRDLVAQFYKSHPQLDFRSPIVEQCNEIVSNMSDVVCDHIPEPLSLDPKVSAEIYKYDTSTPSMEDQLEDGEETYLGFALHCQFMNKCKSGDKCQSHSSELDNKFNIIDHTLRKTNSADYDQIAADFCGHYNCSTDDVKNTPSCRSGGPLSLIDFKATFNCPGHDCDNDKKLMYSYLKNYEAEQIRVGEWKKTHGKTSTGNEPALYSSFVENFLGVEETLMAEGRPVTTETVKKKEQQFAKRGLSTGTAVVEAKPSVSSTAVAKSSVNPTSSSGVTQKAVGEVDNYNPWATSPGQGASGNTQSTKDMTPKKLADVSKESQDMRKELENMINSLKGSKTDKLNTVTDNNSNYVPASEGGMMNDSGLSRAEKRRIDDLRRQIDQLSSVKPIANNNAPNSAYDEQSRQAAEAMAARSKTDDYGYDPKKVAATLAASSGKGGAISKAPASEDGGGSVVEKMLKSEDLPRLNMEELRQLGFNDTDTFVIKVLHENRLIEIPVKKFTIDGNKSIFAPVFNSSNSRLSTLVLQSPLFSDYREYQIKRAKVRRASGLNEALNSNI